MVLILKTESASTSHIPIALFAYYYYKVKLKELPTYKDKSN